MGRDEVVYCSEGITRAIRERKTVEQPPSQYSVNVMIDRIE